MSFQISENRIVIRGVFTDICECRDKIRETCEGVMESVITELYLQMREKEGEWELEDEAYDVIHQEVDDALNDEDLCETILQEYGLNQAFKDYVVEYGVLGINENNLSGCLAFYVIKQHLNDVPNQFWNDIVKEFIAKDAWEFEFVFERE
jgi:hypothetical protein